MVHSLDKPWGRDMVSGVDDRRKRKPGAPELRFTPSQERFLFRLVAKANVPWKYIPIVMREPKREGGEAFAPWYLIMATLFIRSLTI